MTDDERGETKRSELGGGTGARVIARRGARASVVFPPERSCPFRARGDHFARAVVEGSGCQRALARSVPRAARRSRRHPGNDGRYGTAGGSMANAVLIVWRETIEALLVVGILHAWLTTRGDRTRLRFLWGGVAAGLGFAGLLAWTLLALSEALEGETVEYVQGGTTLAAAGLITHMVFWMRRHGRGLKGELETGLARATTGVAVSLLAAIAVGREGAETVGFLYGLGVGGNTLMLTLAVTAGVAIAIASFWLLQRSASCIGWRGVFAVAGALLRRLAR